MVKAKMCIICNRLVSLDVPECPCGSKEFVEVVVSCTEEEEQ